MRVVLVGAGKVGFSIAQMLSKEDHDVVIIEKNEERLQIVDDHLDIQTIYGSGSDCGVLEEAGIRQSKLFISVTETDEVNMVACALAKQYGVPTTVNRIRNPEYVQKEPRISLSKMGIDLIINPEMVTAMEIVKLLEHPDAREIEYFADRQIQMAELKIEEGFPMRGQKLHQYDVPGQFLIVAILRNRRLIVPGGDDIIQSRDRVFVMARTKDMKETEKLFLAKRLPAIEHVVILGGDLIGYYLAQELEKKNYSVKVIEKDKKKCQEIDSRLKKTLVINGDGIDIDLLMEENIGQADAFVAVTDDDKLNLLVCLIAKELGADKTFVQIRRSDLIPLIDHVNIDKVISPRMFTAGSILRYIRRGHVSSVTLLGDTDAEMIELTIPIGAPVVNKTLNDIPLPKGTLVGAIMRGDQVIIPSGDDVIKVDDRLTLFTIPENISRIGDFFESK
ncbi:MAG TPA: Trk system potassium transporter TrkA [Peptococcaceae bacterium]|nr:Trk system potassium transporter TrkA [Peptococcaceae bacterium]